MRIRHEGFQVRVRVGRLMGAERAGQLSVMMPAFNEERTIGLILEHVLARPEVGEVIVVDDGSTDATWEILTRAAEGDPRVRPFRQEVNQGKGAALRRAVGELRMPFALVQDADLEYDPRDYPVLLEPLLEERADVVFGVRGFAGQTAFSFWFVLGNFAVTMATNVLFDCFVSDMETGYKVLRSDLWRRLKLRGERFDIEPDITARVLRLGYRIHEVPIRYYARSREEGKKLTWVDGVRALGALITIRLSSGQQLFGDSLGDDYHRLRQEELTRRHPLIPRSEKNQPQQGGGG
jgi:glycosyltransferase involved in cell wall biosynthesis